MPRRDYSINETPAPQIALPDTNSGQDSPEKNSVLQSQEDNGGEPQP